MFLIGLKMNCDDIHFAPMELELYIGYRLL